MRIIIATDGSEFSRTAAEKACEYICDPDHTSVKVVSAFEDVYPIAAEPFAVSAEFYQQIVDASAKQAADFGDKTAEIVRSRFYGSKINVSSAVLKGTPEQQIIEEARRWKADLIVVGSHGRGFWGRMLGSVSDAVVHHAPCSVLVVRH